MKCCSHENLAYPHDKFILNERQSHNTSCNVTKWRFTETEDQLNAFMWWAFDNRYGTHYVSCKCLITFCFVCATWFKMSILPESFRTRLCTCLKCLFIFFNEWVFWRSWKKKFCRFNFTKTLFVLEFDMKISFKPRNFCCSSWIAVLNFLWF